MKVDYNTLFINIPDFYKIIPHFLEFSQITITIINDTFTYSI